MKKETKERIISGVSCTVIMIAFLVYLFLSNKEQKYIVRYGEIISETEIVTEDGHVWEAYDLPEERYVRVLFDSRYTKKITDDRIIDITEDTREWNNTISVSQIKNEIDY